MIKRGLRLSTPSEFEGEVMIEVVHYQKPVLTALDSLTYTLPWYIGERYPADVKDQHGNPHPLAGKKKMVEKLAFPGQVIFKFLKYPRDADWVGEMGICPDHDFRNYWMGELENG